MITVYFSRLINRELLNMGLDTDDLWKDTGLVEADLVDLVYISDHAFRQLLSNAIKISGDPGFGLRFGVHSDPFSCGDAGIATIAAPDLISSITSYIGFNRLRATYFPVELEPYYGGTQHFYRLVAHEHYDLADTRRTQLEVLLMTLQNVIELAIGRPFIEGQFYFSFSEPAYSHRYPSIYHSPCQFSTDFSGVDLPVELGKQLLPTYNQVMWEMANSRCNQMMAEMASPTAPLFSQRVIEILYSQAPPLPNMTEVARLMHLSERSLHRRLRAEEQSYRNLYNKVQKKWARHYLTHSVITVEAIAINLGYLDSANFRRAFKKWFKCTPSEYRLSTAKIGA